MSWVESPSHLISYLAIRLYSYWISRSGLRAKEIALKVWLIAASSSSSLSEANWNAPRQANTEAMMHGDANALPPRSPKHFSLASTFPSSSSTINPCSRSISDPCSRSMNWLKMDMEKLKHWNIDSDMWHSDIVTYWQATLRAKPRSHRPRGTHQSFAPGRIVGTTCVNGDGDATRQFRYKNWNLTLLSTVLCAMRVTVCEMSTNSIRLSFWAARFAFHNSTKHTACKSQWKLNQN